MGSRIERVFGNDHGFGQSISSSSFVRIRQKEGKYETLDFLGTSGHFNIQTYNERCNGGERKCQPMSSKSPRRFEFLFSPFPPVYPANVARTYVT